VKTTGRMKRDRLRCCSLTNAFAHMLHSLCMIRGCALSQTLLDSVIRCDTIEGSISNRRYLLQHLLKWLDIKGPQEEELDQALGTKANRGHATSSNVPGCDISPTPPMRSDTKTMLEQFYAPFNQMLSMQLGREMWSYSQA
jgi:hypothetical protein